MDRGQIFIGVKFQEISEKELDTALVGYGHTIRKGEAKRLDGQETPYDVHHNSECDFPGDGVIFGVEALVAYVNFSEPNILGKARDSITSGYDRDWIQEVDLEKLADLYSRVKKDIPEARILLMDKHY